MACDVRETFLSTHVCMQSYLCSLFWEAIQQLDEHFQLNDQCRICSLGMYEVYFHKGKNELNYKAASDHEK